MSAQRPEEIAEVFIEAIRRQDFALALEVVHPEALAHYARPFREKGEPRFVIFTPPFGSGRSEDLYEQMNALLQEAEALSDAEIFTRWMEFTFGFGRGDRPTERKPGVEVIGGVVDEPHAYVLIKTGQWSLDTFEIPSVEALRMKRDGREWRVISFAHRM